jgi:hypothetical protein
VSVAKGRREAVVWTEIASATEIETEIAAVIETVTEIETEIEIETATGIDESEIAVPVAGTGRRFLAISRRSFPRKTTTS